MGTVAVPLVTSSLKTSEETKLPFLISLLSSPPFDNKTKTRIIIIIIHLNDYI